LDGLLGQADAPGRAVVVCVRLSGWVGGGGGVREVSFVGGGAVVAEFDD